MALTPRGAQLIGPLEEWTAVTAKLLHQQDFSPSTLDRTFTVATTDYGVLSVLSPKLSKINQSAPGCVININPFSADMFHKLASGELDLIIYGFQPDMSVTDARHVFQESQSLIMRRDHPLAQQHVNSSLHGVSLDSYLSWPHIAISIGASAYDPVEVNLGQRASERRVLICVPYFQAASDLVGDSDAILTLPTRAAQKLAETLNLACLPAPQEISQSDHWLLWHERSARDPSTLWLVDMLSDKS